MRRQAVKRRTARRKSSGASATAHARWCRLVEAATLQRAAEEVEPARQAFQALPTTEQMQLINELVTTRRGELTRAYSDLISVTAGSRVRRTGDGGRTVHPEPCVTLVVKEKRPKARVASSQRLPEAVFAYWTVGGERLLCAVPTDVEDAWELRDIRPRSQVEA